MLGLAVGEIVLMHGGGGIRMTQNCGDLQHSARRGIFREERASTDTHMLFEW